MESRNLTINDVTTRSHQTHYLKWNITDNLSVRYHYSFIDNPEFVNKFILKDHANRSTAIITKDMAIELIGNIRWAIEIIGYKTSNGYSKYIINNGQLQIISE